MAARAADHIGIPPEPVVHVLADGSRVLVRPLVPDDRAELTAQYELLSPVSRRLRFVSAPEHLSERMLDHLLDVDFDARCAIVAVLIDEPGSPGVGVARYARRADDRTTAEAAVTVLDAHQGRGIGTVLLTDLVRTALTQGIATFVADVMWDNADLLRGLRAVGAVVTPGEPGSAEVRVDLPATVDALPRSPLYEVLRAVGSA